MSTERSREPIRQHVVYTGLVQGVCFRATSHELSRRYAVVGYVRNQPDGTVELEAEGPEPEVSAFLRDVETHFAGNITHVARATVPARGDERTFDIRF